MYRVLLVEDDAALRHLYTHMHAWQEQGFCLAAEAEDGREALEKLDAECFDLIVTDIHMPFVDGLELLRALRQRKNNTPVVLVGSYGEFEYAREGLVLRAFDYIVKPVQESQLEQVLIRAAAVLSSRGTKDSQFTIVRAAFDQAGVPLEEVGFTHTLAAFLAAHLNEVVTMKQAAEHVGLSKDYFGKTCKAHTGMTFGSLYNCVRVEHAKCLLRDSSYRANKISERLGFASPDYFTRIFKAQTGCTPSQYRAAYR